MFHQRGTLGEARVVVVVRVDELTSARLRLEATLCFAGGPLRPFAHLTIHRELADAVWIFHAWA